MRLIDKYLNLFYVVKSCVWLSVRKWILVTVCYSMSTLIIHICKSNVYPKHHFLLSKQHGIRVVSHRSRWSLSIRNHPCGVTIDHLQHSLSLVPLETQFVVRKFENPYLNQSTQHRSVPSLPWLLLVSPGPLTTLMDLLWALVRPSEPSLSLFPSGDVLASLTWFVILSLSCDLSVCRSTSS